MSHSDRSRLPDDGWFADISGWRKLSVRGADACSWLNDLVSADISSARPGDSIESLLLSPTGMLRAVFSVIRQVDGTFLMLQDPGQPAFVGDLLAPYVLSSPVQLRDRTQDLSAFALIWTNEPPASVRGSVSRPSSLGAGLDIVTDAEAAPEARAALRAALPEAPPEAVERFRILAGRPRLGVDATADDLPAEAGLDAAVARDKGCYLGQEAVARTRNLGHPRRTLSHLRAPGAVSAGEPVFRASEPAGFSGPRHQGTDQSRLTRLHREASLGSAGMSPIKASDHM